MEIVASLASMGDRSQHLKNTVESLLANPFTRVNIYLHDYSKGSYDHILNDSRVHVIDCTPEEDNGDSDKFHWCEEIDGYHFTCDDDLIYPVNYVETMVDCINRNQRRAVVSAQGYVFNTLPMTNYFSKDRSSYSCLRAVPQDVPCHGLGTGAMAYHTGTIKVTKDIFVIPNMTDIWMTLHCQKQHVPMICCAHQEGWIQYADGLPLEDTIAGGAINDNQLHCQLINSYHSWYGIERR